MCNHRSGDIGSAYILSSFPDHTSHNLHETLRGRESGTATDPQSSYLAGVEAPEQMTTPPQHLLEWDFRPGLQGQLPAKLSASFLFFRLKPESRVREINYLDDAQVWYVNFLNAQFWGDIRATFICMNDGK